MTDAFEGWGILELFGHRRLGGYLREQQIGGASFLRIDIPGTEDGREPATQFYSPQAIYAITPCTEAIARQVAGNFRPEPVSRWDLRAIEAPPGRRLPRGQREWDEDPSEGLDEDRDADPYADDDGSLPFDEEA